MNYINAALTTWLVGFVPVLEIYVAVPVGILLKLDWASAIIWAVFGNFIPVILVTWIFDVTTKRGKTNKWLVRFNNWLMRFRSQRFAKMAKKHAHWFIILVTPLFGVWALTVTANFLEIAKQHIYLYSFISIVIYAGLTALAVHMGLEWIQQVDLPWG